MTVPSNIDFDNLKPDEFEHILPDKFLAANPDCAALVSDLEAIADAARTLLEPVAVAPSEQVWLNIQSRLREGTVTNGHSKTTD